MDPTDDLWTAIRRVLPDAEALAAAVAAELGEPLDDVRPSVLIGTIAINGQLGPEAAAATAIEAELGRLQAVKGTRPPERPIAADSLEDLLAETQALEAGGSLDLDTIVAIQRASGAIAARTDRPIVVLQHRYAVTRRLIWEHCVAAMQAGRLDPAILAEFGRFLLLWNELTSLAVTDGYRIAERDILARTVEARRGALQELLGVVDRRRHGRSPSAPPGRATRPGPRPLLPSGRDRAAARDRCAPRTAGHRRGRARGARRTDRSPARVDALQGPRASVLGSDCPPSCPSWGASLSSPVTTGPGCPGCRPSLTPSSAAPPRRPVQRPETQGSHDRGQAGGLGGGRLTSDRRCRGPRRDLCRSRRRHAHRPAARPAWLDTRPRAAGPRTATHRRPLPRRRHRAARARPAARRRAVRRGAHRDARRPTSTPGRT